MQKHHKRLLDHTRITLVQQESFCRLRKLSGTHTKLEKDQTSMVAHPSQKLQELIQDQSSTV